MATCEGMGGVPPSPRHHPLKVETTWRMFAEVGGWELPPMADLCQWLELLLGSCWWPCGLANSLAC